MFVVVVLLCCVVMLCCVVVCCGVCGVLWCVVVCCGVVVVVHQKETTKSGRQIGQELQFSRCVRKGNSKGQGFDIHFVEPGRRTCLSVCLSILFYGTFHPFQSAIDIHAMGDNRGNSFYRSKWYSKKKTSNESYKSVNEDGQSNAKLCRFLNPIETSNILNLYNTYINLDICYYGWKLFFHDEEYKENSDTVKNIRAIESFINRHQLLSTFSLGNVESGTAFVIDICELYNDKIFLSEWTGFKQDIYENPVHTLNCFKLAMHQKLLRTIPLQSLSFVNIINTLSTVRLKISNYEPIICLQDLKAGFYGKLVSVRGCVIRVGHAKHLPEWIVFICCKCNLQTMIKQPQGIYTVAKKCAICGVSKFRVILDSPLMKTISFQTIKIQELSSDEQNSKGSMPRILDIELRDDLVNTCMPGDDITLTGIIKGNNTSKTQTKSSFSLYMEAITITNNKQKFQNKNIMADEMSIKDYLAIKEVYNTPNIFPLLMHSLCPNIYGHEMIKAGLILSLFGGNPEHSELRENIHVLLVGDPGLGKSQMLQACSRIAAKGVYVCGNSSTSSGLTITLLKENKTNNFTLEPGALVLADRGCCCVDEFDKISKQHAALLESMEQQSVSVAKSGIICSLPSRTSVVAAANPIAGRFQRNKTLMQNLKMSPPLLSRFDLIFLLLDEPNKDIDDFLCKHVMSACHHSSTINNMHANAFQNTYVSDNVSDTASLRENTKVIPHLILRKYIAYARQYVKPKLTKAAATVLQNYYLELRNKNNKYGGLPVYNRQLEAMIRLAEARAKVELRTKVTETDAMDVIQVLRYTFDDKIISWQSVGNKRTTNKKVKQFIRILREESLVDDNKMFSTKRLQEIASNNNILVDNFPDFISKLNESGILLKKDSNTFRFVHD